MLGRADAVAPVDNWCLMLSIEATIRFSIPDFSSGCLK